MLKINLYKILFILQRENYSISTMDLASLAEINYKNIGRYLNILEDKDYISREVYQEKKKRFVLNSLTKKGEKSLIPNFYLQILKIFYES